MDKQAFWGLIGVIIGWALTEISKVVLTRKENKKLKNQVVYNLLEINWELSKLRFDMTSEIISLLEKKYPMIKLNEADRKMVEELIGKNGSNLIENTIQDGLTSIESRYKDCLQEYSKLDPVKAYYLADKTKVIQNLTGFQDYMNNVFRDSDAKTIDVEKFSKTLKHDYFKEAISDLDDEIVEISKEMNSKTRAAIREVLIKNKDPKIQTDNLLKIIDKYIE